MHPTGNFVRDLAEVEKRISAQSRDRQTAERFGAEVATMIDRRRLNQPVQMAAACVEQRAKDLVMRNKAGWARLPANPQKFILVDPQGCVLTDLANKEIPPPIGTILKSTAPNSPGMVISAFRAKVTSAEGAIPHIYLDTNGNATVGIGHVLKKESDAKEVHARFGFYTRDRNGQTTNVKATEADVLADFRNVSANTLGNVAASNYKKFTTVDLTPQGIEALRDYDIQRHLNEFIRRSDVFPNYFTYPFPAQLALLDRMFNRGLPNLLIATQFIESIKNRDWKRAAKEVDQSSVRAPSNTRQTEMKRLFTDAARQEPYFVDPKCPRTPILQIAP